MWWFISMGTIALLVYGCNTKSFQDAWAAAKAQDAANDAICAKDVKLVSKIDGLRLYVVHPECGGRPVYFSKSGTHTTHSECHMVGKVSSCHEVDNDVTNATPPNTQTGNKKDKN